jgi:predicted CoA-substrate-specific enzyme activase
MSRTEKPTLGLDIGSVNTHLAVIQGEKIIYLDKERNYKGLSQTIVTLMDRLPKGTKLGAAGVTGSGRYAYKEQPDWQKFGIPTSDFKGVLWDHPDAQTIIDIGGQGASVIGRNDDLGKRWKSTRSPLCAAGTGRFLEQQAQRLRIPVDKIGEIALECKGTPPRIAARCSVFAKSDMIHLQQKGVPLQEILAAFSNSVAQIISSQWKGQFKEPALFIGGVANNQGVSRALSNTLRIENLIIPDYPEHRGAIGAATLAQRKDIVPVSLYPAARKEKVFQIPITLKPPEATKETWKPVEIKSGTEVLLGTDIGSTSTKAVLLDSKDKSLLDKLYLMTAGQPLEAIKQIMEYFSRHQGIKVKAAGVTGSGRYLVGDFIGSDIVRNEITAQVQAAILLNPKIDTIFEIGGQDSKYVYLKNGTVLNYKMNKACAAGTGSFIDELSEQMGVSTRTGEFARKAFAAKYQIDLGEKCTAFMSQAVTDALQQGVPLEVVIASLATSLAKNYHSKVVENDKVGDVILLTGAVFYNEAIVSAFINEFPGKSFIIPEHKEVTGAIGAALMAGDKMKEVEGRK